MRGRIGLLVLLAVAIVGLLAFFVGGGPGQPEVTIGQPPWSTSPPPTNIVRVMLEDFLDYRVNVQEAEIGVIYTALARGDIDLLADAWVPNLHRTYFEAHGEALDQLGAIYRGADLGWIVPTYVTIDSVEELNEFRDEFDGRVIGIDAGAGMMEVSQEIIDDYDLDFQLVEGSEWAMLTALNDAIRNEEWIVTLGWRPHWKFIEHDLKFLDEPRGHWTRDDVAVVARQNFRQEHPEAARLLEQWELPIEDLERIVLEIEVEGRDPQVVAREWVQENEQQIRQWMQ